MFLLNLIHIFSTHQISYCKSSICVLFISSLSHFTLLALTLDRYIFIKRPLHYPLIVTPSRKWIILLFILTFATFVSVVGFFVYQVNFHFKSFFFFFCFSGTTWWSLYLDKHFPCLVYSLHMHYLFWTFARSLSSLRSNIRQI